jgi:GTPase SAR1 family protein
MGKKLAFKYGMEFAEVSAKDGMGVASLFEELGRQVYEQIKESQK